MKHVLQGIKVSENLLHAERNAQAAKTGFFAVSLFLS